MDQSGVNDLGDFGLGNILWAACAVVETRCWVIYQILNGEAKTPPRSTSVRVGDMFDDDADEPWSVRGCPWEGFH